MVIDPGHDLHLDAAGEKRAGGHVQLPQLHRHRPFPPGIVLPPAAPRPGLDQLVADQHPVHRGPGHRAQAAAAHLEHQPLRPPLAVRPAQLADRRLQLGRDLPRMSMDLVAAVFQARRSFVPVAHQPGMHALTAYPVPIGDLGHRNPGQHFQHGPVSLLSHAQLPQHERSVKHQAEPMCQASSGTAHEWPRIPVRTFSASSRARPARRAPGVTAHGVRRKSCRTQQSAARCARGTRRTMRRPLALVRKPTAAAAEARTAAARRAG